MPEDLTAVRDRLATEHGIDEADADLLLTGTDADRLQQQAQRLAELRPARGTAVHRR